MMVATELYHRVIAYEGPHQDLMKKVWSGTPWMVNVETGSIGSDRYREIGMWCADRFGSEAWPIHGKPGRWHSGGVTIHGWTWLGFSTEAEMDEFQSVWGNRA